MTKPEKPKITQGNLKVISSIYGSIKRKYKLLKYIDDRFLIMLKEDGYSGPKLTFRHGEETLYQLRNSLCNALFRNIALEVYSIFYDHRRDVISIKKLIEYESPDFLETYIKVKKDLKDYRDTMIAHKNKEIFNSALKQVGYPAKELDELIAISEKIMDWYVKYYEKMFTESNGKTPEEISTEILVSKLLVKGSTDHTMDGTIDFFIKRIAGLSRNEISKSILDKQLKPISENF